MRNVVEKQKAVAFWQQRARALARRINFGWWLDWFAPLAFGVGALGACAVLLWRRTRGEVPFLGSGSALVFALAALAAWLLARRRFEGASAALVRLESAMHLHTGLSTAAAGIGAWPEPRRPVRTGLSWRWRRPAALLLASATLLGGAAFLPIAPSESRTTQRIETPAALAEVQQTVDQLRAEKLIEPQALEALQKEAESLLQQPAEQWYQHSSLEAADHLRDETAQSLHDLQNDLAAVERAVSTWQQTQGEMPAAMLKTFQENLADALKGLSLNNLPLDPAHLAQLKNLDPSKLKQLSPPQLAALKQMLQNGQKSAQHAAPGGAKITATGTGPGQQAGSGGPGGGGPPAPLTMAEQATNLGSKQTEALPDGDLSHASLGDMQGLSKGEHQVDRSLYQGPAAGGAATLGSGGDTVWQNSLTPEERAILKNYYQ